MGLSVQTPAKTLGPVKCQQCHAVVRWEFIRGEWWLVNHRAGTPHHCVR